MQEESFQIYDASGAAIGLASRSRVHREGLWHRAANVMLFRHDGRLIIQRRQWTKDVCPGLWDLTVAEHLHLGETYEQGAIRGLREELGIDEVSIAPLGTETKACLDLAERGIKDCELQLTFSGVFDGDIHPDIGEVCEVATIAVSELAEGFRSRPADFTPWFRDTFRRLGVARFER